MKKERFLINNHCIIINAPGTTLYSIQHSPFTMPPNPGKKIRTQYTLEMKIYAIELHLGKVPNREIIDKVFEKFKGQLTGKPSTLTVSTWYNSKNLELYEAMAKSYAK